MQIEVIEKKKETAAVIGSMYKNIETGALVLCVGPGKEPNLFSGVMLRDHNSTIATCVYSSMYSKRLHEKFTGEVLLKFE